MRILRRRTHAVRPRVVLAEASPYGSLRLVVETDPEVSTAYLVDAAGEVRSSLWLANHALAPPRLDQERMRAGLAPPMPAGYTRHPDGRAPLRRRALKALWFEEGDGVALFEGDALLAVFPGWADPAAGLPGYSRDALGRTPLAWALDGAREVLASRVDRARGYWQWRTGKDAWAGYQRRVLAHLEQRLGQGGRYWNVADDRLPLLGAVEHPPTPERPYAVASTVGMSCQRMPGLEARVEDASPHPHARVELALATSRPLEAVPRLFSWLGPHPWRTCEWFGHGHDAVWDAGDAGFPLGDPWRGVLMLADPPELAGPTPPELSGLTVRGDPVRWLWLVPVTEQDVVLARGERGADALMDELKLRGRTWTTQL